MYRTAISWCVLFVLVRADTRHPPTLVVSFDGFRPDYVRPDVTPHLARLRNTSASPPYMRPAFPTKTFVNHFTIATGLHPETHGVLDNYMFDRNGDQMHYTYDMFHYDDSVIPIWIQNENSGDRHHSGVMMWPGSEFSYQGKAPTYIQKYNKSMPWTSRIDKIMSWIKDKNRPANLVFAYFDEPDTTGHKNGVKSQEVKNQVVRVDATVKYLLDQIKNENMENKINLIFLSDHGMENVTYDKMIFLDKYVTNTSHKIISTGANAFIRPNPGKFDEIYKNLTIGAKDSGRFDVYKQNQLPERFYMKNNSRLTGLLYLLAKPGYGIWNNYFELLLSNTTKTEFSPGLHGFDNEDPSMRALFIASGPSFKKNFTALPFDNVDLYPLIGHVIGLKIPADGVQPNGTMAGVQQLLSPESAKSDGWSIAQPRVQYTVMALCLHAIALRP